MYDGRAPDGYTVVAHNDCLPVDATPPLSSRSVSWSAHNVLSLCTHNSVLLCLASVRTHAGHIAVHTHPLCRHTAQQQQSSSSSPRDATTTTAATAVVSAAWSRALLREVHYPAETRVCVQTTRHVLIYRVTRYGGDRVRVSHGIGVAVGHYTGCIDDEDDTQRQQQKEEENNSSSSSGDSSSDDALLVARPRRSRQTQRSRRRQRSSLSSSLSHDSDDDVTYKRPQRRQGNAQPRQRTRRRRIRAGRRRSNSNSSSSDGDDDDDDDTKHTVKRRNNSSSSNTTPRYSIVAYEWYADDVLVVVTDVGVHCVALSGDTSDDAQPRTRRLPAAAHLFAQDDCAYAAPCCASRVEECAERSDETASAAAAASLAHTVGLLVVASATLLRIFAIDLTTTTTTAAATAAAATARLLQSVHMTLPPSSPLLRVRGLPSCVCALQTHTSSSSSAHDSNDVDGNNNSNNDNKEACKLTVFVATTMYTLRGAVVVVHTASNNNNNSSNNTSELCTRAVTSSSWVLEAVYDLHTLANDTALRSFVVTPTHTLDGDVRTWEPRPTRSLHATTTTTTRVAAVARTTALRALVLGVSCRCVYGFFLDHTAPVLLFSCPSLATAHEMPPHSVAGVVGVAVHASCTLSLLALRAGSPRTPPLLLLPCAASDTNGLLYRMLRLTHLVYDDDEADDDHTHSKHRVAGDGADISWQQQHNNNSEGSGYAVLSMLWRRQRCGSFITWEPLLREHSRTTALCAYSEAWRRYSAPPRLRNAVVLQRDVHHSVVDGSATAATAAAGATTAMASQQQQLQPSRVYPQLPASLSRVYVPGHVLRACYRQLRARFGVELFLRWRNGRQRVQHLILPRTPLFSSSSSCLSDGSSGSSNNKEGTRHDTASMLCWWQLLHCLRRRCPADVSCIRELIVGNAIVVMAKRTHYAATRCEDGECFVVADDAAASCSPHALCYEGACDYVVQYMNAQASCLRRTAAAAAAARHAVHTVGNNNNNSNDNDDNVAAEAVVWPGELLAPWCCCVEWLSALRRFVRECNDSIDRTTSSKTTATSTAAATASAAACCSNDEATAPSLHTFACSVCDARGVAQLTMHFAHTSTHRLPPPANDKDEHHRNDAAATPATAEERHTTLFAASTFCPLSLYASDAVLTRCLDCRMYDYATDATCRVCGALLQ